MRVVAGFEEPTAGGVRLHLKLRQAMQVELKRIQREVGVTFVYVTHDQGEALTMSDRIAVMNDGLIEQLGTPREIYEHPATRFVAGFIGTSNLLGGDVTENGSGAAVLAHGPDGRIEVPVRDGMAVAAGERLELTVRPEKIAIGADKPADGLCRVRGTVTEVAYLGTSTNYNVTTSAGADVDTCSRFCAFFGTAHDRRLAYAAGYTGLGVGATRFGADVMLDLLSVGLAPGEETERTRLAMVRGGPVPFPPEPFRYGVTELTRRAIARADRDAGRRGRWLRTLDRLGLGFDS